MLDKKKTVPAQFPWRLGETYVSFEIKLWSSEDVIEEREIQTIKTNNQRKYPFVNILCRV